MNSLANASNAIIRRSDEIRSLALNRDHAVAELFSPAETEKTIDVCIAFMNAVAGSSTAELHANAPLIDKTAERVADANDALDARMTLNTLAMNFIIFAENTLFDRIRSDPKDVISLAKKARLVRPLVKSGLRFFFSEIRRQVESPRPKRTKDNSRRAAFMRNQKRVFNLYLKDHPVKAGFSRITRAHECWLLHQGEWNKASVEGIGYSDYKALART